MGRPTAPIPLLLLLLRPAAPSPPCFAVPTGAPTELDLANSSRRCPELDWGPFQLQRRLLLSHNGIEGLSPAARAGPALEELDFHNRLRELPAAFLSQARGLRRLRLQHNRLRTLPAGFFADATALQSLHLEGNPLSAVPPSAFQPHLLHLDVPCRCDAVGSVLAPCACSRPNCTAPRCRCLDSHEDFVNVTDFHARHCWGGVGLVAGSAVAAVAVAVLLVVVAAVCYRRRKMATGTAGAGWGKWEPAAAYGQPRYISPTEIGAADAAAAATATAAPDYENVFVSPGTATAAARGWTPQWQEKRYSPPGAADADYFLESEADAAEQPIYANTQTLAQDDIYIVPNQ
ncbi:LOW QUALITY PROTEIN: leucine-rich repeat-containing protein 25 [Chlamydotis macqueenii]